MSKKSKLTRRDLLKWSAAATAILPLSPTIAKKKGFDDNYIVRENLKQGATDWILQNPQMEDVGNPFHWAGPIRSPWVEGYANKSYIRACEDLTLFVSTNPSAQFTLDVYRIGYYGGTGARHIDNLGTFQGTAQPMPTQGAGRVMDCKWTASHTFSVPSDWLSGVYVIKITELTQNRDSYIQFTIVDDRQADFAFSVSDITNQCYNRWPEEHSLYNDGLVDNYWSSGVQVSFNRPYTKDTSLDQNLTLGGGKFFKNDYAFVYFLEKEGYDVTYVSERAFHYENIDFLTRVKGILITGHSEYWTQTGYNKAVQARDAGVSYGFFCGNTMFGRVNLHQDDQGNPDQYIERGGLMSIENELMGGRSGGGIIGGGDWRCMNPTHWIFDGTDMVMGETIKGLVGNEYHDDVANIPGLEIIAQGVTDSRSEPATMPPDWNNPGQYTSTLYYGSQGNVIFNASTIRWADCLETPPGYLISPRYQVPDGPDERCRQITKNFLNRVLSL